MVLDCSENIIKTYGSKHLIMERLTPCVKACILQQGSCIACKRTLEEITQWSKMSNEERSKIMENLKTRN